MENINFPEKDFIILKISNPNLVYNKLSPFDEQFYKDLNNINNNYGKMKSRGRLSKNHLLK